MSKEPKRNVYVGHRYVPKIMGEWDKAETYEGLSIVTYEGTSYTSKKRVPKGIDILNEEYWVVTGNYNAQIEEYRKDVREIEKEVGKKSDQSYVDNLNEKVTTQLAQTQKYPIKENETAVTNENYPYGDIRRYGAIGDDTTDCTQAIQTAIDNAYILNVNVQIPEGTFLVTSPLILPKSVWIKGVSHNTLIYYISQGYTQNCVIRSTSQHVFERAETNTNKKVNIKLTDVYFKNSFPGLYEATVFYDIEVYSSFIEGCAFDNYGTIFFGVISTVTRINNNSFSGIGVAFIDGNYADVSGGGIVDSFITNNYMNGKPEKHATCFKLYGTAMSTITNNFIDFFKIIFDFRVSTESLTISNNIFDCAYRVITSTNNRSIQRVNVTGNIIRNIDINTGGRFFPTLDTDMTTNEWIAIEALNGMFHTNIINNQFEKVTNVHKTRGINNYDVNIQGNTYKDVDKRTDYIVSKGGNEQEQKDIYIDKLNMIKVSVLPSPLITGSNIVSFNRQQIIYNNKLLTNIDGQWVDAMGNVVTE